MYSSELQTLDSLGLLNTRMRELEVNWKGLAEFGTYVQQHKLHFVCRPMISNPSSRSPAYGARITLSLSFMPSGQTATISRVVMISSNGITHSTHFDQRSVGPPHREWHHVLIKNRVLARAGNLEESSEMPWINFLTLLDSCTNGSVQEYRSALNWNMCC